MCADLIWLDGNPLVGLRNLTTKHGVMVVAGGYRLLKFSGSWNVSATRQAITTRRTDARGKWELQRAASALERHS